MTLQTYTKLHRCQFKFCHRASFLSPSLVLRYQSSDASPSDFGLPVSKILDPFLLRYLKMCCLQGWYCTAVRDWNFRTFQGLPGARNTQCQGNTALKQYIMAFLFIFILFLRTVCTICMMYNNYWHINTVLLTTGPGGHLALILYLNNVFISRIFNGIYFKFRMHKPRLKKWNMESIN